jgi:hypothetical protein
MKEINVFESVFCFLFRGFVLLHNGFPLASQISFFYEKLFARCGNDGK